MGQPKEVTQSFVTAFSASKQTHNYWEKVNKSQFSVFENIYISWSKKIMVFLLGKIIRDINHNNFSIPCYILMKYIVISNIFLQRNSQIYRINEALVKNLFKAWSLFEPRNCSVFQGTHFSVFSQFKNFWNIKADQVR